MSLLVIEFTFLEGRDCELVVTEFAAVDSHIYRVSSYVFKRPYSWEEVHLLTARMNQAIDHGCNWNDCDVPYADLENVLHREAPSTVAIYCLGLQKTQFISGLLELAVVDCTRLGCPQLADICQPAISCTFACHNNSKHVCALRTAHSLAQWLNLHILSQQHSMCPAQTAFH